MTTTIAARNTISSLCATHLDRRRKRFSEGTLSQEKTIINKLDRWWTPTRKSPKSMTIADFEDFLVEGIDEQSRRPLTPSSYNHQLSALKPFMDFMLRRGIWPFEFEELRKTSARPEDGDRDYIRLNLEQIHDLIDGAPNPWERWILAFFAFSFGRAGELLTIRVRDMNNNQRIKWWRHKTRSGDEIPMFPEFENEWQRFRFFYANELGLRGMHLADEHFAIPGRDWHGGTEGYFTYDPHRSPSQLRHVVKENVARLLGIDTDDETLKNQACHLLRRSAARAFYDALRDAGVSDPIRIVMAMLGHTKVSTTEIYLGIKADRERRDKLIIGGTLMSRPVKTGGAVVLSIGAGGRHGG